MTNFHTNSYNNKTPFIHKKNITNNLRHISPRSIQYNHGRKKQTTHLWMKKKIIDTEKYLHEIKNPSIRQSVTKLRLSNRSLNTETGRYKNLPKQLRFCPFCPSSIESEVQFLIECNTFNTLRREILQEIIQNKLNFVYYTPTEKFELLLSGENIYPMSKFIHNCFEIRSFLTANPKQHIWDGTFEMAYKYLHLKHLY